MGTIPEAGWTRLFVTSIFLAALATGAAPPPDGWCAGNAVRISNVSIQEEAGQTVVRYDLEAREPTPVRLVGSLDGGRTFSLPIRSVEGDTGPAVPPGAGRTLRWSHKKDFPSGLENFEVTLQVVSEGRKFFRIPLHGRFGVELDEDPMRDFLRLADAAAPDVVVLDIDSPGGSAPEMEDVLDMLLEWKEKHPAVRVVSLVRNEAVHAAAFFVVAADAVFFLPGAVVGASDEARPGGNEVRGSDRDFPEELVQKVGAIAEKRGIAKELLQAMLKPARLGVALSPGETRRVVVLEPGPAPIRYSLLGKAGRPLRLVASQAVLAGLAVGTVKDYDELGLVLGYPNWISCGDGAQREAASYEKQVGRVLEGYANLSSMIKEGLSELNDPDAAVMDAKDVAGYLELVGDLGRLGEDFPFVAARMELDFPAGLSALRSEFQPVVVRSAAPPSSASRAPARNRRSSGSWAGVSLEGRSGYRS